MWTDEKTFVLHQNPHLKHDGKWPTKSVHEIFECKYRNDNKIMILVVSAERKFAIVYHFFDEEGRRVLVDGA